MEGTAVSLRMRGPARAAAGPWILGPGSDLAWFLLAPAWILILAWAIKDNAAIGSLSGALLAVCATGHHLPGFIRAYADPGLFRRFRLRFLLAPAFFLGVCAAFALLGLHGLSLILLLWGAWHGAMQVSGFARIYDSKAGSTSSATAWLDWAVCAAWFGGGLLHSQAKLQLFYLSLHRSGWSLPSAPSLLAFRHGWDGLCALVTLALLGNAFLKARKGESPNPLKIPAMAIGIGFWWFCMVQVRTPLLGLLLFEIFHDTQYNALVWGYQRNRVAKGMASGWVERLLFQASPARIALYTALILAYGCLGAAANYAGLNVPDPSDGTRLARFLAHLFIASAFLHFYYDGFIWKVREAGFRAGAGIDEVKAGKTAKAGKSAALPTWLSAAMKWSLFILPVSCLAVSESGGPERPPLELYRALAPLMPESWEAQYILGGLELQAGEAGAAAASLQAAARLKPDLEIDHRKLAELYGRAGNAEQAIAQYRLALARDPKDMASRYDLGLALRNQGRVEEAIPELRAVADGSPGHTGTNYSAALALLMSHRVTEAIPYLQRSVAADPLNKMAWNSLGVARESQGMPAEAVECYRRALQADTGFIEARNNLRAAEKRSGSKTRPVRGDRPGLSKYLGGQSSGGGEIVFQAGDIGLHHDGIHLADGAGTEIYDAGIHRALTLPQPYAVYGNPGCARADAFAQG